MTVLTDLTFLDNDQRFPPQSQVERLESYERNRLRFKGQKARNEDAYKKIISLVDSTFRVVEYRFLINLFRKVSLKTGDLLFIEPPDFSAGEDESANKAIASIVDNSDLSDLGYQAAIDASRYGDCILTVNVDGDSPSTIGIMPPTLWFPVSSEGNIKKIEQHVLAWKTKRIVDDEEIELLQYQIHEKGSYAYGEKLLESGVIKGDYTEPEIEETGIDGFAIIPAQNVVTSDTVFGINDYDDFANLVDELEIRLEKIAHVLDKHSDPTLSGPASALTFDEETGQWYLRMGDYLPRNNSDEPPVEYLTWDGKLDSSFQEITLLLDLIAVLSEMGSAIFDRDTLKGANLSGRALRFLYVNPLTKVRRIRNKFTNSLKEAISLASQAGYDTAVEKSEISIGWKDGLPDDEREDAEIAAIRTGAKPNDTIVAQIMKLDNLSKEDAEAKARKIVEETNQRLLQSDVPAFYEDTEEEAE